MGGKIKLIIADDEPFICGMLERLIQFDEIGMELIGCFHDGLTLEKKIQELKPDVVLTDISMPKQDGLDVIRKTREKGIKCRFVIISGYKQFEYAYNALKYDVDDYLLKPVEKAELNHVLQKISNEICHINQSQDAERMRQQSCLIEEGISEALRGDTVSLEGINRTFQTRFRTGYYRFLMLKLDFTRDEKQHLEDISSVIAKLRSLGRQCLEACCNEAIFSEQRNRILFLLNYREDEEKAVRTQIDMLYVKAKHVIELFQGFNLTLCAGRQVDQLEQLETARQSCMRAEWLRMHYGINRVIYEEAVENLPLNGFRTHTDKIREELERSYISMDTEKLRVQYQQLFLLPSPILCGSEAIRFVHDSVGLLCQQYAAVTKNPANAEAARRSIQADMEQQTSFRDLAAVLADRTGGYLQEMLAYTRDKNTRPVLQACAYIESHYSETISLETIAGQVYLNPIYFSNLFKRETGKSFTEYLTDFRMKKAKEMLRNGNDHINEIAVALGYSNARYFSKVFKKEVGVKPTDYRKIYG